jgi:GNAT superfamily N-acetyltransferase
VNRVLNQRASLPPQLALLSKGQIDEASYVLGRAFQEDGMFIYVFPNDHARARHVPVIMKSGVRYGFAYGQVTVTQGAVHGAAVTALHGRPGASRPKPGRTYKLRQFITRLRYGPESWRRYQLASAAIRELHVRNISGPHWYLLLLGVNPPKQGTGLGGILLKEFLDRADRDNLPIYLDTFKRDNLTFYTKYGFEVKQEMSIDGGKAMAWALVRQPRRP